MTTTHARTARTPAKTSDGQKPGARGCGPIDLPDGDPTRIGYARVSTGDQTVAGQVDALTAAGCGRIFCDEGVSGGLAHRPALDAMLAHVRRGDTIVVVRLDRVGRSLAHLVTLVEDLTARGVGLASLSEAIDTSTATGRMVLGIFGTLAEFERALIRERTMAGLQAARARGRVGGRPTVQTVERREAARKMVGGGMTLSATASMLGVSRQTVRRMVQD